MYQNWFKDYEKVKGESINDVKIKEIGEMLQDKINYLENELFREIEINNNLQNELDKKEKIINELLTEITDVNSGRYEYMDNDEVLEIFTKKVEEE